MDELKQTPEEAMEYAFEDSVFMNDITEEELEKAMAAPEEDAPLPQSHAREHAPMFFEPQQPEVPEEKPRSFLPRTKLTFYALIMIFSSIFLLCAIYLGKYYVETKNTAQDYDYLADLKNQATAGMQSGDPTDPTYPTNADGSTIPLPPGETQQPEILPDMKVIYDMNNDLVGWLKLPALKIDYPVMQTPNKHDYYLRRDFYHKQNDTGCLYVREKCNVFTPSDNVVIYGHAMKTGDMFGRLHYYRQKSYWQENQYFTFETLYERHTYQIFAVFITSGTQKDSSGNPVGYPYHSLNDFSDAASFDQFIADIKGAAFTKEGGYVGKSLYDTGITPVYGDKLVCLSTCEYTIDNGRLVIMGVRVD